MTKVDIARQYRDKYGMDMPTLKLARIMYSDNKLVFKDVEHARYTLRIIEGKSNNIGYKITHKLNHERPRNPYNLPKSEETNYTPHKLHGNKIGIL